MRFYAKKVRNFTKEKDTKKTKVKEVKNTKIEVMLIILIILVWVLSATICIQGILYSKMLIKLEKTIDNNDEIIEQKDNMSECEKNETEENRTNSEQKNNENKETKESKTNAKAIGKLSIPDINLKDKTVYEGTDLEILGIGIGHFMNTSICNGNVGLASHNSGRKRG